jgi:hypothetical protein
MGDVPRTDALWNKLACPREPTGSLSEAIYSPEHRQNFASSPPSPAHVFFHAARRRASDGGPKSLPRAGFLTPYSAGRVIRTQEHERQPQVLAVSSDSPRAHVAGRRARRERGRPLTAQLCCSSRRSARLCEQPVRRHPMPPSDSEARALAPRTRTQCRSQESRC